jgi:anti-sigma regulatory factor (Ser/Thr protein kinase)
MGLKHSQELLNQKFPSLKDTRKDIIEFVLDKIAEYPLSFKLNRSELYLVIDEALTNAMEHGNKWDPGKNILIQVAVKDSRLNISIEDEGKGFNTSGPNTRRDEDSNLSVRGRGIKIIRKFCNPIWNTKGNRITLQLQLND